MQRHITGFLRIAPVALFAAGCAQPPRTAPSAPAFSEANYRKHIEVLASDAFEGRAPGTAGEKKTLDYIEQQFRAAGLQPGVGDSFLQPVPIVEITTHADTALQVRNKAQGTLALR